VKITNAVVAIDAARAVLVDGVRPPLGVLVLDDGTQFTLDRDYVLGREPAFDSDVIDGRAEPLRINDPNGTVSRLHLRISLAGWQVEVSDLGPANGSVLQSSGAERNLAPFEPTMIEPGARIGIGHRSMQYLAYQGVLP
jgi:FHA domain-containing protein